jgi:hypothetical protein
MTEAKAFRTFIRIYSLFESERLSANIKVILIKESTDHISNDICLSRLGISGSHRFLTIAKPAKQGSSHRWKLSEVHTGPRFALGFQLSI